MSDEIAVLLSIGRHPVSGRPCVAPRDASALELALRRTDQPLAIHAGKGDDRVLADYLGMGLPRLIALDSATAGDDILHPLADFLRARKPRLILCGMQGGNGECSGMLPYLLARQLDLPLIADVAAFEIEANEVLVSQAVTGGRRRRLAADLPAILTIGAAGPKPRQWAFAKARRGGVERIATKFEPDTERLCWMEKEARQRPRRLRAGKAEEKSPAAALTGLTARQAAEKLHAFLMQHGVIRG